MKKPLRRYILVGWPLIVGLLLTIVSQNDQGSGSTAPAARSGRLLVLGVPRLCWETVLGLAKEDRLPFFSRIAAGSSVKADIIADGYTSEPEILGSILTGMWPNKFSVSPVAPGPLPEPHLPAAKILWNILADHGGQVLIVGFSKQAGSGANGFVSLPDRQAAGREETTDRPFPARWTSLLVQPEEVATLDVERLIPYDLHKGPMENTLRKCLADDQTMVAIAGAELANSPQTHLFFYLSGLRRWLEYLQKEESGQRERHERLAANYLKALDRLLGQLASLVDNYTTVVLFSEQGCAPGPLFYRPYLPDRESWPPTGFFLAWGHNINTGVLPLTLAPVDIAPTLCALAGVPVPLEMDGSIQMGMLTDDFFFLHPLWSSP